MPALDDDYQNRYYQEGVFTNEQLESLKSVVNPDDFWDDPDADEEDDLEWEWDEV